MFDYTREARKKSFVNVIHWCGKKKRLDRASIVQKVKPEKVSGSHLIGTTLRWEENHLDATRERHFLTLNREKGTFFLNVILPMAYSRLHGESSPNKMWERKHGSSLFLLRSVIRRRSGFLKNLTIKNCNETFGKSLLKIYRRRFDVWLTSSSRQKVKDKKISNTEKDNSWFALSRNTKIIWKPFTVWSQEIIML